MESSAILEVQHEPDANRFTCGAGDSVALLTYRVVAASTLDFDHTFVPPALRGGGIASRLTERALQYAAAHGYKVIPSCPFVAAYIGRHPRHAKLVASRAPHGE